MKKIETRGPLTCIGPDLIGGSIDRTTDHTVVSPDASPSPIMQITVHVRARARGLVPPRARTRLRPAAAGPPPMHACIHCICMTPAGRPGPLALVYAVHPVPGTWSHQGPARPMHGDDL